MIFHIHPILKDEFLHEGITIDIDVIRGTFDTMNPHDSTSIEGDMPGAYIESQMRNEASMKISMKLIARIYPMIAFNVETVNENGIVSAWEF